MNNTILRKISSDTIKYPVHTSIDFKNDFEDKVICSEEAPKLKDVVRLLWLPMLAVSALGIFLDDAGMMLMGSIYLVVFVVSLAGYIRDKRRFNEENKTVVNLWCWLDISALKSALDDVDEMKRCLHMMNIRGDSYEMYYEEKEASIIIVCDCVAGKSLVKYSARAYNIVRGDLGCINEIDLSVCDKVYEDCLEKIKNSNSC